MAQIEDKDLNKDPKTEYNNKESLNDVFSNGFPVKILLAVYKNDKRKTQKEMSKRDVSDAVNGTYNYVNGVIDELERWGLLKIEEGQGRKKNILITAKGQKIASKWLDLYNTLEKVPKKTNKQEEYWKEL